ncbi:MAG: hypothetical protein HYY06_33105 [Deltaproteobacteria bacterium]|nr:hypothetical protein [Deltaproteobacteria bacterium]
MSDTPRLRRYAWFPATPISDEPPDMQTLRNAWIPPQPLADEIPAPPELLSLRQAEILSGRTQDTLLRWVTGGLIKAMQDLDDPADPLRIRAAELRALLANLAHVPSPVAHGEPRSRAGTGADWELVQVLQSRIDELRERVGDLREQVQDLRCDRERLIRERDRLSSALTTERERNEEERDRSLLGRLLR